jgi:aerobic carbon-monoxide dehydrogenase large subunit
LTLVGSAVLRREDARLLTGRGTFVANLDLPGALHVAYVRSTVAHGRVVAVDVAKARAAPGVVDVVTAADLDPAFAELPPDFPVPGGDAFPRPFLAGQEVRFVGEPVAAVLATTVEAAVDAAELVVVELEPLAPVVDPEDAGAVTVFGGGDDDDDAFFQGCDVVVRQRLVNQRVAACPMEPRSVAARWGDDGRLTYWAAAQRPHGLRAKLASLLAVDPTVVRVVTPDVGGSFGTKGGASAEELLVAWLARRHRRPVRWTETRSESMLTLGHGRGQVQYAELGGTADGRLLAYRLTVVQDGGAYPSLGMLLPMATGSMLTGVYDIERAAYRFRSVLTNTAPVGAYRGAGRPEATAAIERAVDLFATEIGMDPVELRAANLVERFPHQTARGTTYDSGDYRAALEQAMAAADYPGLRREQRKRRAAGRRAQLGIGVSVYVEVTGGLPGGEHGWVEVAPDGGIVVRTGSSPQGQGHETAWAMLAADALGCDVDAVTVVHGDTDAVPAGIGTGGSRSLQTGGVAVHRAATLVREAGRQLAAELFEADPADVVDVAGGFQVAGSPDRRLSWPELAGAAVALGCLDRLAATTHHVPDQATFPFGAHLALVEVDVETGEVRLIRFVAVDDAGRLVNPLLAEGQVHGGVAQGVGQALLEEMVHDGDGTPRTATFADYAVISSAELPWLEAVPTETPTPVNELAVKGVGESGAIGATPAVQNAVVDALAHLGVRHVPIPTTPERVWRALQEAET